MGSTTDESPSTDLKSSAMDLEDFNQTRLIRKTSSDDNNRYLKPTITTSGDNDHNIADIRGDEMNSASALTTAIDIDDSPLHSAQPPTSTSAVETDVANASYHGRPSFTEHLGSHRQYWRDMVLGVNDGLVSTFLLIAGVSGGGLSSKSILLTGISGGVAGAISMAAGEFMATKSQDEVFTGEIKLERLHIQTFKSDELLELKDLLARVGIDFDKDPSLARKLMDYYANNDEALLKAMVALEFGCIDNERRIPWKAALYSLFCFILGSLPSIIPFAFTSKTLTGLLAAVVATCIGLVIVGIAKTWATRGSCFKAALENLSVALAGGAAAYGIGVGFENLTN